MAVMHVCVHNCSKYIYEIAEVLFVKQHGAAQVAIVDHTHVRWGTVIPLHTM